MVEGGSVSREEVILVLRTMLSEAAVKIEDDTVTVYVGDNPRAFKLPARVTRRMIQELANRYDIAVHFFYNVGMLQAASHSRH